MRLTKHRASYLHRPPRGVVGIIAPWNFPLNLPFGTAAMALMAGNAVVLKPSEFTPLIAERTRQVWVDAGVPADLLGVVYGYGDVGAALVDAGVDMVEFTGSVATGKKVAAMCGERLVPCVMELGGKAPALVFPDCNFERTVEAVTWAGSPTAGRCARASSAWSSTSPSTIASWRRWWTGSGRSGRATPPRPSTSTWARW